MISREDLIKLMEKSQGMPALLKIGIVAFLRAMPEDQYQNFVAQILSAGESLVKGEPGAREKIAALGIPDNVIDNLTREVEARRAQYQPQN